MSKNVLITGCNGYIGNAIVQRMLSKGYNVTGIDNDSKITWLKEMKSVSAIDVFNPFTKVNKIKNRWNNYQYYDVDISKEKQIRKFFKGNNRFDVIINLAQMPSAPYSQIDLTHSSWTIQNNTIGCLNILWMMKEYCPNAHLIEIESMGTFNPAINVDIPENKFQFEYNGRTSEPSIFPKQASSFYHSSKVFNTYLNDCANRWWGIKSTIINQGVVYGNYTPEIEQYGIHSHLSSDESFGTVINRFIVQALIGTPLTIYGNGDQKRCFLALNDSVQCLELFVDNPPEDDEMRIVNQLDEVYNMNQLAEKVVNVAYKQGIDVKVQHIDTPREENTDEFYYNPLTDTLKGLGFKQTRTIEDEIEFAFRHINRDTLEQLKDVVMPKIKWK